MVPDLGATIIPKSGIIATPLPRILCLNKLLSTFFKETTSPLKGEPIAITSPKLFLSQLPLDLQIQEQ